MAWRKTENSNLQESKRELYSSDKPIPISIAGIYQFEFIPDIEGPRGKVLLTEALYDLLKNEYDFYVFADSQEFITEGNSEEKVMLLNGNIFIAYYDAKTEITHSVVLTWGNDSIFEHFS